MKLDSPIATFTVVMIALIITLVLSFALPLSQIIMTPLLIVGFWFILLGITQKAKPHELMTTTPSVYIIYGGLMLTISVTYLTIINVPDVRFSLIIFILGTTLTIALSRFVGTRKKD